LPELLLFIVEAYKEVKVVDDMVLTIQFVFVEVCSQLLRNLSVLPQSNLTMPVVLERNLGQLLLVFVQRVEFGPDAKGESGDPVKNRNKYGEWSMLALLAGVLVTVGEKSDACRLAMVVVERLETWQLLLPGELTLKSTEDKSKRGSIVERRCGCWLGFRIVD
jgi:hypothetical protein